MGGEERQPARRADQGCAGGLVGDMSITGTSWIVVEDESPKDSITVDPTGVDGDTVGADSIICSEISIDDPASIAQPPVQRLDPQEQRGIGQQSDS